MEGNQMKMREALVQVLRLANVTAYDENWDWNNAIAENVVKIAKEALAKPPRNCDVGTPEVQIKRFEEFCNSHTCTTMDCKVRKSWSHFLSDCGLEKVSCGLIFALMPYEAEEGEIK